MPDWLAILIAFFLGCAFWQWWGMRALIIVLRGQSEKVLQDVIRDLKTDDLVKLKMKIVEEENRRD